MERAVTSSASNAPASDQFPPGLHNIFLFIVFNSLSFQVVLNSPMVLYAKSLNASATVLGILTGMMPLLVVFQIPAARYLERTGYKRFVFAGWGTRTVFIAGMALVPLAGGFLDAPTRMALILALLFCFNLVRGITTCAWLPWITGLIPASLRGKYLARDLASQNIGGVLVFVLSAFWLGAQPGALQFSLLFAFSAAMGGASLTFLRRVPEGEPPAQVRVSATPVPWREIAAYPPFRKLVWASLGWAIAYGGINTFVVAFLKSEAGVSERNILLVMSVFFIGGLGSLRFLGPRLDRMGSKPVLTVAVGAWLLIGCGWFFIAGGTLPARLPLILSLLLLTGFTATLVEMARTRLLMAVAPAMGRDHFFALFSVVTNVVLGLSPVFWGVFIDCLSGVRGSWRGVEFNRFSLFFLGAWLCFFATLLLVRKLDEPRAASMEELLKDFLSQSRIKTFRLWRQ
jgi:MFS family permease